MARITVISSKIEELKVYWCSNCENTSEAVDELNCCTSPALEEIGFIARVLTDCE